MNDPPPGTFATEDNSAAREALGVAELERHEHDTRRERLNAKIDGREAVKRRAAGSVGANIGEHGAKCRIDGGATGDALGHVGRGLKDGGRVGEGGAKWLPLEILECGEEAPQRAGDRRRVATSGGARLGSQAERQGEQSERGKDSWAAREQRSSHHWPFPVRRGYVTPNA